MRKPERSGKRTRGTGGLGKIEGSRFWYVYYYGNDGKQRRESSKSESKMVAEQLLQKRLGEMRLGLAPAQDANKLRYEQIRDALLAEYRSKGTSIVKLADGTETVWGLKHLDDFFGGMKAQRITTDSLRKFIQKRHESGAEPATVNRNLALLRRMMNLARREGKFSAVPYFPMQREAAPRQGFLENQQFAKLRDAMPEDLRPLLIFLYFTGCRLGAAQLVQWNQIEFVGDRALLRLEGFQTKNDEPLLLPLPKELGDTLKRMKASQGPVFLSTNLRKAFQVACVTVGLGVKTGPKAWQYKGLLIHDLRRSGVRNLIRSGVHRTIAMRVSGHKTESVFERYNIVDSTDLLDAMKKVETSFDASLKQVEQDSGLAST